MRREFNGDKPSLSFFWERYPDDPIMLDLKPAIAQAESLMKRSETDLIKTRAFGENWGVQVNITTLRIQRSDSTSGLSEMYYELLIDVGNDAEQAE